jgi:ParB family chromosome partitioning protein
MSKRRVFDIDFEPEADEAPAPRAPETKAAEPRIRDLERRGPMATAISENAAALSERQQAEAAIREENDRLAHEFVQLKKDGAIVGKVLVNQIRVTKLTRDRSNAVDPELEELKASIRDVGLSNPIHVEEVGPSQFELIQGFRRWSAYKALLAETGEDRFARIPAVLVAKGAALDELYRRMVDENLVRKDISFAEMANLSIHFARDRQVSVPEAVDTLFASAGRQKRSYIRHFCELLRRIGRDLRHPEAIPRALGLRLVKALETDPKLQNKLTHVLAGHADRSAAEEMDLLARALSPTSAAPASKSKGAKASSKQTIRLNRPRGQARVSAAQGKVELQMDRDFGSVDPRKLELAVRAFLEQLGL